MACLFCNKIKCECRQSRQNKIQWIAKKEKKELAEAQAKYPDWKLEHSSVADQKYKKKMAAKCKKKADNKKAKELEKYSAKKQLRRATDNITRPVLAPRPEVAPRRAVHPAPPAPPPPPAPAPPAPAAGANRDGRFNNRNRPAQIWANNMPHKK